MARGSFCEGPEGVAIVSHELLAGLELCVDCGVEGGEQVAFGRFDGVEGIALLDFEAGEHFLGDDGACGGADGGEFEGSHGVAAVLISIIMPAYPLCIAGARNGPPEDAGGHAGVAGAFRS